MKVKQLIALALLLTVLFLCSVSASAETIFDYGNWSFVRIASDEYEVHECRATAASLTVPYQVDQYRVTSVGAYAFLNNDTVTTVTMKPPLQTIGDYAFAYCAQLTDVYIPDTVTGISDTAFLGSENVVIRCEDEGSYAVAFAREHGVSAASTRILGDVDGDGEVTIFDVTTIQRLLVWMKVANPDDVRMYGDVNGDGLDILDATLIRRRIVSLPAPDTIGQPIWQY